MLLFLLLLLLLIRSSGAVGMPLCVVPLDAFVLCAACASGASNSSYECDALARVRHILSVCAQVRTALVCL